MRKIVHLLTERLARFHEVVVHERPFAGARLGEQVAAEQRPGRLVEKLAALPPVRQVWRGLPHKLVAPGVEWLPVGQADRLDVDHVAD